MDTDTTPSAANQRMLAAIVFTDVVGFSFRMAKKEEQTLELLQRDISTMTGACVQHNGQVLKKTGDGLLMCFHSATDAMQCALVIQNYLDGLLEKQTLETTLQHRVGVHLGDVFVTGEDIMGDGVNIASRIMTQAGPNGICFSGNVFDLVEKILPSKPDSLGTPELKNINRKIPLYHLGSRWKGKAPSGEVPAQTPAASRDPAVDLELRARAVLERVKSEVKGKGKVFSLAKSVEILRMLTDEANPAGLDEITNAIIKDPFLTMRVLSVSNSAHFNRGGKPISTVSQAVLILGMAEIRSILLSVVILEQLPDQSRASNIRNRSIASAFSGSMARSLAQIQKFHQPEQAFLAGAFSQFGALLVYSFLPDLADQYDNLIREHQMSSEAAALQTFGMRLELLGKKIGEFLALPPSLVSYMDPLNLSETEAQEVNIKLLDITKICIEVSKITESCANLTEFEAAVAQSTHLQSANITSANIFTVMQASVQDIEGYYANSLKGSFWSKIKKMDQEIPVYTKGVAPAYDAPKVEEKAPPTRLQIFQDGVATVASLMGDSRVTARTILMAVCETMYRGFQARSAVLAIKNENKTALVGCVAFGENADVLEQSARVSINNPSEQLPEMALKKNRDIFISNIEPKLDAALPAWIKNNKPSSFILLPIIEDHNRFALIYVDGSNLLPEGGISGEIQQEIQKLKHYAVMTLCAVGKD